MGLSLGQAAKATALSKTTLSRAIKSGKLSAARREDGSYDIDPSELHRVFPDASPATVTMARSATGGDTGLQRENELLREMLERERALNRELAADLRAERDHWRAQATALLSAPPAAPARIPWWRRWR